jgi:hypothetical protein
MSNNTYNGWTNRETWLVNVWFNPESKSDVYYAQACIEEQYEALPDFMRDFVNLDAINWDELLEHFETDDETEDEEE